MTTEAKIFYNTWKIPTKVNVLLKVVIEKNGGNFKSNFWPNVTKKLNGAVKASYTQEVMKSRN